MPVTVITSFAQFKEIINGDKPVVIDFWATWCGPCRMISPVFEKLSNEQDYSNVAFYKVDVDEQEEISQEVGIRSMPTFAVFYQGNKVNELIGANPPGLQTLIQGAAAL
ncbi:hypothetical protein ASPWEDRAFT_161658 [Aspergillus wentii DTO 134E9]|uniref:Thioredoxin n=1 Tax=Aspergillus wentii DTO 134E9 TaxID=1073089 RepID=A0A1L9RBF5_ASPWE|nr:uncharacterized protein ASPWEDRAFT_161658 [Aspergillus wentii DTO 134E9]KAI9934810.1 hypothetical protein MW887_000427 [Aspergillus wentii]OJJ32240.1 hypothetical protein ASPWEDRAFT_161658 [Aspergillus wentii DTO 134E9]